MDLLNLNPNPDPHAHTKPKRTKKKRNYPENNFGTLLTLRVPLAPELVSPAAFTPARPHARDTHAQAIYRLLALRSGQSTSAPRPWFVGRAYRLCSAGETGQCSSVVLTWLGTHGVRHVCLQGQVGCFPGEGGSLMGWGDFSWCCRGGRGWDGCVVCSGREREGG
jgi:hypothetical protein